MKCLFIEAILEIRFLLYFYSLKQTAIAETTETRNSYDFNGRNVLMLRKKNCRYCNNARKKIKFTFQNSEGKKSKSNCIPDMWKNF